MNTGWEEYRVEKATEIVRVIGDKKESLGFLRNPVVAEAYCEMMKISGVGTCKTVPALVLTDGVLNYRIVYGKSLAFLKEDLVITELKERVKVKLSSAEQALFNLEPQKFG